MKFLLIFTVCHMVSAFISRPAPLRSFLYRSTAVSGETSESTGLQDLINMILNALPLAINTPSPEMNKDKVINNPARFYKPTAAGKFKRGKHDSEQAWKTMDIIKDFNDRYGVGVKGKTSEQKAAINKLTQSTLEKMVLNEKDALVELLEELEEMEILDEIDHQLDSTSPFSNGERYIAEGAVTAFTKLDKPMDAAKVVPNPKRFVKPMSLKDIKKKLKNDPFYFQH